MTRLALLALPLAAVALVALALTGCEPDDNMSSSNHQAMAAAPQMTETTCPCGKAGSEANQLTSADGKTVQQFCCGNCQKHAVTAGGATIDMTCPTCGHAGSMKFLKTSPDGKTVNAYCSQGCMDKAGM